MAAPAVEPLFENRALPFAPSPRRTLATAQSAVTPSLKDAPRRGTRNVFDRICAIIDSNMAQLIVRDIPQQVVARLKQRAARRGHSAEAEHREILKQALLLPRAPSLKAMLGGIPDVGRDADFGRPRRQGRRVVL